MRIIFDNREQEEKFFENVDRDNCMCVKELFPLLKIGCDGSSCSECWKTFVRTSAMVTDEVPKSAYDVCYSISRSPCSKDVSSEINIEPNIDLSKAKLLSALKIGEDPSEREMINRNRGKLIP